MGHRFFEFDARSPLWIVSFHPEATLHMGLGKLCFMQDPPSGYWSSPEAQSTIIYRNDHTLVLCNFIWPPVIGCTEVSISLRQAKRGVIGALQVNATWRNEPRAREAERPATPFGLSP